MKSLNQLYPVDGSANVPGFLLYGAQFITDNSELVSDVPAMLASALPRPAIENWTLAYLVEVKSWELGLFLSLEGGELSGLPHIPRHSGGENFSFVDDQNFEKRVADTITHLEEINTLFREYARGNQTPNKMFAREVYVYLTPRALDVSSPMTEWLLKHPKRSVSLAQAFQEAILLYQEPRLAVAVISYLLWLDNAAVSNRQNVAVLTSRFLPLFENDFDPNGSLYHFWGYLRRTMSGDNRFKLWALSYGHEILGQGSQEDRREHRADDLGIDVGTHAYAQISACDLTEMDKILEIGGP